jgi:diguanylate cyclase (GGDEF)-like protein/PAS domain S-box-containing protein
VFASRLVAQDSPLSGRRRISLLKVRSASREAKRGLDASAILESLDDAVIARRLDGVISTWNAGAERLYGYPEGEAIGAPYEAIVSKVRWGREMEMVNWAVRAELSDTYETERLCKDGTVKSVSVQISPIKDAEGAVSGVATIEREVRERRPGTGWSPELGEYLRSAFEHAPIGVALVGIFHGSEGNVLRVNRALCELTGRSATELEHANVSLIVHPDDVQEDRAMATRLASGELAGFQFEQRLLHADGHSVWVMVNASIVRDGAGNALYCIRQMQDIEERKRFEVELGYLVEHDPLTGLLNRRGFIREVTQAMAYARRYGGGGAMLFLDVDDLKYVNDTHGHVTGDEVINEVARVVLHRLRETDVFARIGGDEFAVLLPHTSASEAEILGASLLDAVREGCEVTLRDGRRVTVSIGITAYTDDSSTNLSAEELLIDADMAMYAAKDAGKGRVSVASLAIRERPRPGVTWVDRIRRATADAGFELHCQPIVDLAADRVAQWELLLRLPGDRGELILPAQFLCTAERSGLILAIDRWVVSEAIRLIAEQRQAGRDVQLSVNLAGRSVGDRELLRLIERRVGETGIDPASLVLEVSETAAIASIDRARTFATRLSAIGCLIALDDFGAGFGSFYYVKHIPFDFVKIDGEFIRNLPSSPTDQTIVDSVVDMSRGLGKSTIAEFVGDRETVVELKQRGVDYAQGYYVGRPVPLAEAFSV